MTGIVAKLGDEVHTDSLGRDLKEGDRVAYTYFFPCLKCYTCLRGQLNTCPNRTRIRKPVEELPVCSGGFAEYFYLPRGHFVFKVPSELSDAEVAPVNCAVSQVIFGLNKANIPVSINEISISKEKRMKTSDLELNRVLGGGIVPGSVVLVGGDPGIGKSTLLLQLALTVSTMKVLYISGEESETQIKMITKPRTIAKLISNRFTKPRT